MSLAPKDVDELKKEAHRFLYPRIVIGLVLLVIMAAYIFWPR
jgi:uncharacterized membrane protein